MTSTGRAAENCVTLHHLPPKEKGREDEATCLSILNFVTRPFHLTCIAEKKKKKPSDIREKEVIKMQHKEEMDVPEGGWFDRASSSLAQEWWVSPQDLTTQSRNQQEFKVPCKLCKFNSVKQESPEQVYLPHIK